MLVFNLTNANVEYRKKLLRPYGSADYSDLSFVPDRDRGLEKAGVLAFGALPKGWKRPMPVAAPEPRPAPVVIPEVKIFKAQPPPIPPKKELGEEEKEWKKKKHQT